MNPLTATSKGAATRDAIIDKGYEIARFAGVEGLSIGPLAQAVGMSKSGVFAHFGSREDLQIAVIDSAATRFAEAVLTPALAQRRGLPRLRTLMTNWFDWVGGNTGGCVLLGSVTEFDDRPGPIRDQVMRNVGRWITMLERAISLAIECGELRPGDTSQYAFELYSIPLTVHHQAGLFGYTQARHHGEAAVERWLASNAALPPSPAS